MSIYQVIDNKYKTCSSFSKLRVDNGKPHDLPMTYDEIPNLDKVNMVMYIIQLENSSHCGLQF